MQKILVLYTINEVKMSSHLEVSDDFKINPISVREELHQYLDECGYAPRKLALQAVLPADTQVIIPDEWEK